MSTFIRCACTSLLVSISCAVTQLSYTTSSPAPSSVTCNDAAGCEIACIGDASCDATIFNSQSASYLTITAEGYQVLYTSRIHCPLNGMCDIYGGGDSAFRLAYFYAESSAKLTITANGGSDALISANIYCPRSSQQPSCIIRLRSDSSPFWSESTVAIIANTFMYIDTADDIEFQCDANVAWDKLFEPSKSYSNDIFVYPNVETPVCSMKLGTYSANDFFGTNTLECMLGTNDNLLANKRCVPWSTASPSNFPSESPTIKPSVSPTKSPTKHPTGHPTTTNPTTTVPTFAPSSVPITDNPTTAIPTTTDSPTSAPIDRTSSVPPTVDPATYVPSIATLPTHSTPSDSSAITSAFLHDLSTLPGHFPSDSNANVGLMSVAVIISGVVIVVLVLLICICGCIFWPRVREKRVKANVDFIASNQANDNMNRGSEARHVGVVNVKESKSKTTQHTLSLGKSKASMSLEGVEMTIEGEKKLKVGMGYTQEGPNGIDVKKTAISTTSIQSTACVNKQTAKGDIIDEI
eukprot:884044_1